MGVLYAPLEYYNVQYSEIFAGDQIEYCRTVAWNVFKDNLFHRLMNY